MEVTGNHFTLRAGSGAGSATLVWERLE